MDEEDAFDAVMNRASSPIRAPPDQDELQPPSPTGLSSSSADGGSLPPPSSPLIDPALVPAPVNARKRPAEDLTQLASTVARKIKLNSDDREAMNRYAKASPEEQHFLTFGQLLKVSAQLAVINPPDATYTLSPLLKNKIGKHCARRMLSPAVLSYKAGDLPLKQVQAILLKRPSWGYTKAVKADKVKSKMINKTIQKDLTDLRCDIKKTIGDSMWLPSEPKAKRTFEKLAQPQNIISLCETLVSMPSVKDALVPVTFDMLGRVAILRALLVLYPDETTYWEKVDARLLKIRTKADNDRAAISRAIGKMLKADQEAYGPVDVEPILAAAVQPPGDDDDSDDEEEPAT